MSLYADYEHPFIESIREEKEHGADHLSAIYNMLSGAAPFNVGDLYTHLDEVSSCLDWSMPYKPEHEDYLHSIIV
jgi:hypothetical protein